MVFSNISRSVSSLKGNGHQFGNRVFSVSSWEKNEQKNSRSKSLFVRPQWSVKVFSDLGVDAAAVYWWNFNFWSIFSPGRWKLTSSIICTFVTYDLPQDYYDRYWDICIYFHWKKTHTYQSTNKDCQHPLGASHLGLINQQKFCITCKEFTCVPHNVWHIIYKY